MIKQVKEILNKTYDNPILRRTTVPLLMSSPGQGKSTIVEQFAKERGVKIYTMILSQLMPSEVAGICMPDVKSKSMIICDSELLTSLQDGDILFIDECLTALKQTLDAFLNLLQDRRLPSGRKLANILIVAASNPQNMPILSAAIKERFVRYDLKFEASEYQAYLKGKYGMPEKISTHLCTLINKEKFDQAGWDYVTPRSIEKAINQIGCEMESPYGHILIPFLSEEIVSPIDITSINIKQGDNVPYIELLKLIVKNENLKETEKQLQTKVELIN